MCPWLASRKGSHDHKFFAKGAHSGKSEVKGNTKELLLIQNLQDNLESFLT